MFQLSSNLRRSAAFFRVFLFILLILPFSLGASLSPVQAMNVTNILWTKETIDNLNHTGMWYLSAVGDKYAPIMYASYLTPNATWTDGLENDRIPPHHPAYDLHLLAYDLENNTIIQEMTIEHNVFAQPYELMINNDTLYIAYVNSAAKVIFAFTSTASLNWTKVEVSQMTYNKNLEQLYGGVPSALMVGNDSLVIWPALDYSGTYSSVYLARINSKLQLTLWDLAGNYWGTSRSDFGKRSYYYPSLSLLDNQYLFVTWGLKTLEGRMQASLIKIDDLFSIPAYMSIPDFAPDNLTFFERLVSVTNPSLPRRSHSYLIGNEIYTIFCGSSAGGVQLLHTPLDTYYINNTWNSIVLDERRSGKYAHVASVQESDGSLVVTWALTLQPNADKPPDSQVYIIGYDGETLSGNHITFNVGIIREYPVPFIDNTNSTRVAWVTFPDTSPSLYIASGTPIVIEIGRVKLAAWLSIGAVVGVAAVLIGLLEFIRRRRAIPVSTSA